MFLFIFSAATCDYLDPTSFAPLFFVAAVRLQLHFNLFYT
jgi:hypothetical protein